MPVNAYKGKMLGIHCDLESDNNNNNNNNKSNNNNINNDNIFIENNNVRNVPKFMVFVFETLIKNRRKLLVLMGVGKNSPCFSKLF